MSFSFLSTKLYIPAVRAGAIARPQLIDKLLSGIRQPGSIVLLSGPAGFGKTTLLSAFAAQSKQPIAWLSLEDGENDPNRFWAYLIAACQTCFKEVGETAQALLRAPQQLADETIPTLLINDIASQAQPLVLVLDDVHTIQNPSVHAGLQFLIEHLPDNLHLVISTRADPPWPLARYRARSRLIEIRMHDLRFNIEEASEFLNHTMGLSLSSEALAALEERTEGWIAGLQLAALSMQGRSDSGTFIRTFTGSHIYIAEYLVAEVLKRQPDEMQHFLLKTSILDRLNAGLCETVSGCQDGEGNLKALYQANIFLTALDDEGKWFRYHHLFADLLKARLQGSLPREALAELHRRAARWYEQNGMIAEAVDHALAAADYPDAVRFVEVAALPMILQAYVRTVEVWLERIPSQFIEKNPRINMAYAWMNLLQGTPLQAAPFIDRLQTIFSGPDASVMDKALQAEWLAIQAELLISQGRPAESRDLAIQVQRILPAVDPNVRGMIFLTLAKAYQLTLDYDRAAEVFQMIVQDARRIGDITFEILGTSGQAQMILKQGRLRRTYEIVTEGISRVEMSGKKVPFSATLYGELGQVYFHWHQFNQAREYLRRSMEVSGKSGYSDPEIYLHIMLSKMRLMEGDLDGSVREMEQASHLAGIIPPVMVRENVISQQVIVNLTMDRPDEAEKLLAPEGFTFGKSFCFPAIIPDSSITLEMGLLYNSAFRVLVYQARRGQNPTVLKHVIDLAEQVYSGEIRCQHLPIALETLLLISQMYRLLGETQQSLATAARALELAEPEGYISVFVEEGPPVAEILTNLVKGRLSGNVRSEYLQEILSAYHNPPHEQAKSIQTPTEVAKAASEQDFALVEPLSPRELEVLRLVADGASNREIAEKLFITVSAVKKHTGNIYGKLNVTSRTQAISRARQLGLLSFVR